MNTPTTPFHLHATHPAADALVGSDDDLPSEVAGQPVTYFWKEMIHVGNYVHPERQFSLTVDQPRLQRWAETGVQMLAAGVAIPINCDHSDRARDVVGYVKGFKLEGGKLLALCQFIGEDAALTAARNLVSVGIDPDFTDGQANHWGEAIVHLALTPVPVVPNQGQFIEASQDDRDELILLSDSTPEEPTDSSEDDEEEDDEEDDENFLIAISSEELQALQSLIPGGETITEDDVIERIIQFIHTISNQSADLSAARKEIALLSSRLPPDLDEESRQALIEAATVRFDAAVANGGLSPAARDRLIRILVRTDDGTTNLLTLSRRANSTGDRALALAVADALMDNPPLIIGESTGLQALARLVPGDQAPGLAELQQYMTRVASK